MFDQFLNGLFVRLLLFVECAHIGHYKTGLLQCFLNGDPHTVFGVVKFHRHPAPRFKGPAHFLKGAGHQPLIILQGAAALHIHHRFRVALSQNFEPSLPEKIEFRIVQVVAKGWVNENVIERVIRE